MFLRDGTLSKEIWQCLDAHTALFLSTAVFMRVAFLAFSMNYVYLKYFSLKLKVMIKRTDLETASIQFIFIPNIKKNNVGQCVASTYYSQIYLIRKYCDTFKMTCIGTYTSKHFSESKKKRNSILST